MNEFELIARYFTHPVRRAVLGVGDDCALIAPSAGMQLAISTDMLLEGRHFLPGADPEALGHKTLAVNLSDCAAVGAAPRYALLAGALPDADPDWLEAFARGFFALADRFDVEVIGGDTTRGPRTFCVTIIGEVPEGKALLRSGAKPDDVIWVSGEVGAARLGLALMRNELAVPLPDALRAQALKAMHRPLPRIGLGLALRDIASAAIDISDGLTGDVGHILERSNVGADIEILQIPVSEWLKARAIDPQTAAWGREFVVAGGDDYELCFTAPPALDAQVLEAGRQAGVRVTPIGRVTGTAGLIVRDEHGRPLDLQAIRAFDHFAADSAASAAGAAA